MLVSHSLPSPSKNTCLASGCGVGDITLVSSSRLASANCKKAACVKWGEAEERVMLCISTLMRKESRLTGSERL